MPKLKYAKFLYLDENARIEGGREYPDEQPHVDFDDLLMEKAVGRSELACKFGIYDMERLLQPMPKEMVRESVVKIGRPQLADARRITPRETPPSSDNQATTFWSRLWRSPNELGSLVNAFSGLFNNATGFVTILFALVALIGLVAITRMIIDLVIYFF